MRALIKRSIVTMAAVAGVLGLSSAASALTVDLLWSGTGTPFTGSSFTGSETVSLEVWFSYSAPPPTVQAVVVSLSWDSDYVSLVSCNLINKTPGNMSGEALWQPVPTGQADCPPPSPGLQPSMDQVAAWAPHTVGDTVQIGTLALYVSGVERANYLVTPFMSIDDGWADGNWTVHRNAVLNDATVHVLPEPATAILVGAGFLGLLAAVRRRRRH